MNSDDAAAETFVTLRASVVAPSVGLNAAVDKGQETDILLSVIRTRFDCNTTSRRATCSSRAF